MLLVTSMMCLKSDEYMHKARANLDSESFFMHFGTKTVLVPGEE